MLIYALKWNISINAGKKTNKYFVSTGEGMWKIKNILKLFFSHKNIKWCENLGEILNQRR